MATITLMDGATVLIDDEDIALLDGFDNWRLDSYGYARGLRPGAGRRARDMMHRLVLSAKPGQMVDHINGDIRDNRRSNLRFCTIQQNSCNRKKYGGTSKFKGVTWNRNVGKWQASIKANCKNHYLGLFQIEEEAARTYDAAARILHGEFARLNFQEAA